MSCLYNIAVRVWCDARACVRACMHVFTAGVRACVQHTCVPTDDLDPHTAVNHNTEISTFLTLMATSNNRERGRAEPRALGGIR